MGEILIFVDDDNVLDPNYLSRAAQLASNWPILGAWGAGLILPEFEVEPPPHLKEFIVAGIAIRQAVLRDGLMSCPCICYSFRARTLCATKCGRGLLAVR